MSELIQNVAALYVDPLGPYPKLVEHWWDEQRDARTYAGPWPVVAHPPCGPWGMMKGLCTKQDKSLAPIAVEQVRRYGGVLEHPAQSKLWSHCDLPVPNGFPDRFGGRCLSVRQVSWGHACEKHTWLYLVGVPMSVAIVGIRSGGAPTHLVTTHVRMAGKPRLRKASANLMRRTPVAFAEWLISLAASASWYGEPYANVSP